MTHKNQDGTTYTCTQLRVDDVLYARVNKEVSKFKWLSRNAWINLILQNYLDEKDKEESKKGPVATL